MGNEGILSPHPADADRDLDKTLRPAIFEEFVGQTRVVDNIRLYVQAANQRGDALDHILISGPPGLGKTTLAHLVARELEVPIQVTSGPILERAASLAGILTNLQRRSILFVDEIHRLPRAVEEYLYAAMEEYRIDIVIDQGPSARSVRLDLAPFTLVGATTREGLLTSALRSRFGVREKLAPYPWEDLHAILRRSASILDVELMEDGGEMIARRSRGNPRIANRFLRRIRDLAQVENENRLDIEIAEKGLGMLGIDEAGLEEMDRHILRALVQGGGEPVGLKTLAASVGEEEDTLEEVYEPHLIREGFVTRTPRGRKATPRAFEHLKMSGPSEQKELF